MASFNPTSTRAGRALQAWQILVGHAMRRQTLTYNMLGNLMFDHGGAGVLNEILGCVAFFCDDNECPPLTVIVVNQESGEPGLQIPVERDEIDLLREKVFSFDWYDVVPPSVEELQASFDARVRRENAGR